MARLHPLDFFAGAENDLLRERMAGVFRTGWGEVEAHVATRDGRRLPYYFNGVREELDGRPCLLDMGIEVSARVSAERALMEADARLRRAASARVWRSALSP